MRTSLYNQLKELAIPGICSFVNPYTKRIYIMYSINLLEAISRNISSGRYKSYKLSILETNTPTDLLRVRALYWYEHYKLLGYTILNKRTPVKYNVTIRFNNDNLIEVRLVPYRGRSKILGIFNTMEQASSFATEQKKKYCL